MDAAVRIAATERLANAVASALPGTYVVPFGSSVTGLALPGTSDIDLCAFDGKANHPDKPSTTRLRSLAKALRRHGMVCTRSPFVVLDRKVRVPLIKFNERLSGLPVDISMGNPHGALTSCAVSAQLHAYPQGAPLIRVLKFYLRQRQWNDTASGGIGSYLLNMMALHVLAEQARVHATGESAAELLLRFLRTFGTAASTNMNTALPHEMHDLVGGGLIRTGALRYERIGAAFGQAAEDLVRSGCLSTLLAGNITSRQGTAQHLSHTCM